MASATGEPVWSHDTVLLDSLFGRKKKKPVQDPDSLGDSIADAGVGDVLTISDYLVDYEDSYFIVDKKHRYTSGQSEWFELEAGDGEKKLWVFWSQFGGLSASVTTDNRPLGLSSIGITDDDLTRMDEEHSIDNFFPYEATNYYYQNSGEAFFYDSNTGNGEGFYVWEFVGEGERKTLSIDKWEGLPFQAYVNDIVSPDSITVYMR